MKIVDRLKNQVSWDAYRLQMLARWNVWDRHLCTPAARMTLAQAQIYAHHEQSIFLNDALARELGERGASMPPGKLSTEDEIAYRLSPGFLEPEAGYAFTQDGTLIEHSLCHHQSNSRHWDRMLFWAVVPDPRAIRRAVQDQPTRDVKLAQAASLLTGYKPNYYHVLIDALPKVAFFEALGMPAETELIVSAALAQQPYFQAMQQRGSFAGRRWRFQREHEYLPAQTLWCGRLSPEHRRWLDRMLDMLDIHPNAQGSQRIFVTRAASAGRTISNMQDILAVLGNHHIEIIDAAQLPWAEQVELFGSARLVVGIHGAGLTNLLFRRGLPTDVLEIFSPFERLSHFYRLARLYGYRYAYIVGQNGHKPRRYGHFTLAPAALDAALQKFSSACEDTPSALPVLC
jgi:hypothetical protein